MNTPDHGRTPFQSAALAETPHPDGLPASPARKLPRGSITTSLRRHQPIKVLRAVAVPGTSTVLRMPFARII
eukprot:SAG11_NODE_397_length_9785_cov_3.709581_2_plen_72_part_00